MGNKEFVLAGDGLVQVTPCGEFPHVGAGVTQVIDREACDRIAADFNGRKSDANYPGVLVDFDHFSLDTEKSSEAAGWISDLESRDTGLWARVRWSDAGLAAVQGGRFRLMSPVFHPPSACEDLGGGRIRPAKLVSIALTNEPNIKGGKPIANREPEVGGRRIEARGLRTEGGGKEIGNRWSDVARTASLAVRQAKAEARKKDEGERMNDESVTGDSNAETRETQRLEAAREVVKRELATKVSVGHHKAHAWSAAEAVRREKARRRGAG